MASIKAVKKKTTSTAGLKKAIDYIKDPKKTLDGTLMYGVNCNPENAFTEFMLTKEMYEKTDKVMAHHFSQNFAKTDDISPEKALELGKELAEKYFKDYEVVITTHVDKEHMHNHILVNSVSLKTGKKFDNTPKLLENLKSYSDLECKREGLSVIDRSKKSKDFDYGIYDKNKYEVITRAVKGERKSYILELWKNVNSFMKKATSKEHFISLMKEKGYGVKWTDTRKYVTFIPPVGNSIRDTNLAKTFGSDKYTKEGLLNEFRRNREELRREAERQNTNEVRTRIDGGSSTRNQEFDSGTRRISTEGDRHTEGSSIKFGGYNKDIQRATGEGQRDNDKQVQRDDRINKQIDSNDSGQLLEETAGRIKESTGDNEIKQIRNDSRNESNDRKVSSEDRTSIFTKNGDSIFNSRFNSSLSTNIQDSGKLNQEMLKQIDENKNDKNLNLDEQKIDNKIKKYEDRER